MADWQVIKSILTGPYAYLAYVATLGAWIFVALRLKSLRWTMSALSQLPEPDRIRAIELVLGPVPEKISAKKYLRNQRNRLVLIGVLAALVVLSPLFTLSAIEEEDERLMVVSSFFGLWAGEKPPKLPGEKLPGEKLPGEKPPGEKLPGEKLPGEKLPGEKPPGEKPKKVSLKEGSEVRVGSAVEGIIRQIFVTKDATVTQGQQLAIVAREDLEADLEDAEAAKSRAEERKKLLEETSSEQIRVANLELAAAKLYNEQAHQRQIRLRNLPVTARSRAEAENALAAAENSVELAQARLDLVEKNAKSEFEKIRQEVVIADERLRKAKIQVKGATVFAPVSGRVISIMNEGELVSPSSGVPVAVIERSLEPLPPTRAGAWQVQ